MSDCERYTELMSQMLDGELPAEQAAELRTHIETCAECKRVYEAFEGVSEALSGELAEPPEMLAKGVMFKIKNQKKHRRFVYGKFTALAACLALILLGAAKYGFFGGGISNVSLDNATEKSKTFSAAETAGAAQSGAGDAVPGREKLSRAEMKMGVKLKKTDSGTVYQLGFPVQNVQLLEGAEPEKVEKEPAMLLSAKKIEVYKGRWYSSAELTDKDRDKDETKNEHITTVTDEGTLDELDALLTSVPDDTTKLTVDSKEFTEGNPVCTLYIPVQQQADSAQPKESAAADSADESHAAAANGSESKTNSFRESLASMKNSLLNKTEDAKESPSASPDNSGGESESGPMPPHDLTISVYYVNGEIWCVAQRVDEGTAGTTMQSGVSGDTGADDQSKTGKPMATAKPSPSDKAEVSAAPTDGEASGEAHICPVGRILYKAAGTPEKLDALLKKLEAAGSVLLTENTQKKAS